MYANLLPTIIHDVWELSSDDTPTINIDVLMPNGYFMKLEVDRELTLAEIKEDVWETAQNCPLFNRLRDRDYYVFQCINLNTAQREELVNEDSKLCDVRPFQAVLKLVEKKGDKEASILASRLRYTVGQDLRPVDEQSNFEVADFKRHMKSFCDSITSQLKQDSWEKRVLNQYPVCLEASPDLPQYLQDRLLDGNLVLSISMDRITELKIKISVPPSLSSSELLMLIIKKRKVSIGIMETDIKRYALKICGLEEYLISDHPLSQYKGSHGSWKSWKVMEL